MVVETSVVKIMHRLLCSIFLSKHAAVFILGNLLVEDNSCVKSCRIGHHNNGFGTCVPCPDGICEKGELIGGENVGKFESDWLVERLPLLFLQQKVLGSIPWQQEKIWVHGRFATYCNVFPIENCVAKV